jgi:transcriptional regulator with XRE-family HTH domain
MPRRSDPRDAEIAKRLRALRLQRGLSQSELGNVIGVTFQQVQKYERGANRISASRLQRIAEMFDVPVTFFYSDLELPPGGPSSAPTTVEFDFLQTAGALRLVRAYSRINNAGIRLKLLKLAEHLGGE